MSQFFVDFIKMIGLILLSTILYACGGGVEVGYSPPIFIPVRISVDPINGEVSVGVSSREFITPIGRFDLELENSYDFEYTLIRMTGDETITDVRLLIVRVDSEMTAFKLKEGEEFKIEIQDNQSGYRKVNLIQENDGDIVLELESINNSSIGANINTPTPTLTPKPAQKLPTSTHTPPPTWTPTNTPTSVPVSSHTTSSSMLECSKVNNGHAFDGGLLLGCEGYIYYAFYNDYHVEKVVISEAEARANQKSYCGQDSENPYLEWGLSLAFCKAKQQYGKSLGNAGPYADDLNITFGDNVVYFNGEFGLQKFIITGDTWAFGQ